MSSAKKSRNELISAGYCPRCSKCTAQVDILQGYVLHGCRKCGILLMDGSRNYTGPFVEITREQWDEMKSWYNVRMEELEKQASDELPGMVETIVGHRKADSKGLTLVN